MTDVASRIFVGRQQELAELRAAVLETGNGQGRLVLVSGEAGMGKSRLAAEAARAAVDAGFRAFWGRCWESGGAPAFWPWTQILRAYLRSLDAPAARSTMAAAAPEIASLLPEAGTDGEAVHGTIDAEHARFRLYDAVAAFLRRAGSDEPIVIIVDDLHAADPDSLLLLQFIARDLQATRLLIIGTYREVEAQRSEQVGPRIAELLRDAVHLPLRGLADSEVADLIARAFRAASRPPPSPGDDLVLAVARATEGNPLFVSEVVRLWLAESALPRTGGEVTTPPIPQGVRETVRRRLRMLPPDVIEVLRCAAVIGREFDRRVLGEVFTVGSARPAAAGGAPRASAGSPVDVVRRALSAAESVSVVAPIAGDPTQVTFAHALFRDTLYHDIARVERATLHRRVARAIETVHHAEGAEHLEDVAYHLLEAAEDGDVDDALRHAGLAAEHAQAVRAYDNAVALRERALRVFDGRAGAGPTSAEVQRRCDLLLALGSSLDAAGRLAEAKRVFLAAAELAQREQAAEQLAQAAVGYGGSWLGSVEPASEGGAPGPPVLDDTLVRLLREAIHALGDRAHPLRARALARLAVELNFSEPLAKRRALAEAAIAIARSLGDQLTLARVLCDAHIAIWHLSTVDERLAMADEILRLAEELRAPDLELTGRGWQIGNLFEAGRCSEMEAEVDRYRRVAEFSGQRRALWALKTHLAMRALLTGSFAEGKRLAREALEIGDSRAGAAFAVQLSAIRRELGEVDKLAASEPMLRWAADAYPTLTELRAQLATVLLLLNRREDARGELERIATHGFADVREDPAWANTLCEIAEVAVELEDRERARMLYEILLPYAGRNALGLLTTFSWGSIARTLGRLATCLESWDAAEQHFVAARERNRALRSRPWLAHTEYGYAVMLVRRDGTGDRERARELLRRARPAAETLSMKPLADRCGALLEALERPDPTPANVPVEGLAPADTVGALAFRREGDVWRIRYSGREVRLRHHRGLGFIARLLTHPGQEISALELVSGPPSAEPAAGRHDAHLRAASAGDAGEHLDLRALSAYRARVAELSGEIEEAESNHDVGRVDRLRAELEFVRQEVQRAVGLGGRLRRAGSPLERARINVSRAVSDAIQRIASCHPELGRHLGETVRTGNLCSYRPDPRVPIVWQT